MTEVLRFPTDKVVIFRYVGGPKDGGVMRFIVGSTPFDSAQKLPYEIIDQTEMDNVLTVTWAERTSAE